MKTIDDYLERASIRDDLVSKDYAVIDLNDNPFNMRVRGERFVIYYRGVEIGRNFNEDLAWHKVLAHYIIEVYNKDEMVIAAKYGMKQL